MTVKLFKRWIILPIMLAIVLLALPVLAQNSVQFNSVVIQVWPEFDQPEALIIYHGELADTVSLPANLVFNIPAGVSDMNAVAVFDASGSLVNQPFQLTDGTAGAKQLSFSVDSPRFQFEYYDPDILQKDGKIRTLNLNPTSDYAASVFQIEVQQPFGAQDMALSPPADDTVVGSDQFTYFIYRRDNVAVGDGFSLSGTYTKESDTVTTNVQVDIPQPAGAAATSTNDGQNWQLTAGYVLVGLGIIVLLIVGGMWFYNNMKASQLDESSYRPTQKGRKTTSAKKASGHGAHGKSKFCHQCGAEFQADAKFCHQCGARRR